MNAFDYVKRSITINNHTYILHYLSSLVDDFMVAYVIQGLYESEDIYNGQIKEVYCIEDSVLAGNMVLEGQKLIEIDVKSYPSRSIEEPETEKSVRGSKDGFVESILTNVGLIRRRIRNPHLVFKKYSIGTNSSYDVSLCYIDTLCNQDVLNRIDLRLQEIHTKDLVMSDRALEELLIKQGYNPFPMVRYSERPDIIATHILKGNFAIITDTSSSVMMVPTTIQELLEHVEEHRQVPIIGTIIRWIRILAVFLSLYLVPIWMVCIELGYVDINSDHLLISILIVELFIELMKIATIHTPTSLSSAMGIIAAILLGEFAIDLGFFIPDILFYCATNNVCHYATPNYELSLACKYIRIVMIIILGIFKIPGFIVFNIIFYIYLNHIEVFGMKYFKFSRKILVRKPKTDL